MPAFKQLIIIVIALAIFMPNTHVHLDFDHDNHQECSMCQTHLESAVISNNRPTIEFNLDKESIAIQTEYKTRYSSLHLRLSRAPPTYII
ncbi:MAG: hypothetical protein ACON35_02840 [Candidatus Marinamargulisbacteria bacterium]